MDYNKKALQLHKKFRGKIEIKSKVPLTAKDHLSIAYTPGVGAVSMAISKDKEKSWELTNRANQVAIVCDGTAILGLGDIGPEAGMLFAIIFLWTPPHSWALALFSNEDYARAGVPMLPVVAGKKKTKAWMAFYIALLIPSSLSPVYLGFSGMIYGGAAAILGGGFVYHMIRVWRDGSDGALRPMFFYSIYYLFLIFAFLLVDRMLFIPF